MSTLCLPLNGIPGDYIPSKSQKFICLNQWYSTFHSQANINLQDKPSPIMELLIYFHDHAVIIIVIILTVVSYIIIILISRDPQISRTAKSQKNLKTQENCEEHVFRSN